VNNFVHRGRDTASKYVAVHMVSGGSTVIINYMLNSLLTLNCKVSNFIMLCCFNNYLNKCMLSSYLYPGCVVVVMLEQLFRVEVCLRGHGYGKPSY
jgi:energy-converting hydrogenase Eha subunit C